MMSAAWPKRILFGHTDRACPNGRKTGIREGEIRTGFWPRTQPAENVLARDFCTDSADDASRALGNVLA
jgi:hypothetical protein